MIYSNTHLRIRETLPLTTMDLVEVLSHFILPLPTPIQPQLTPGPGVSDPNPHAVDCYFFHKYGNSLACLVLLYHDPTFQDFLILVQFIKKKKYIHRLRQLCILKITTIQLCVRNVNASQNIEIVYRTT